MTGMVFHLHTLPGGPRQPSRFDESLMRRAVQAGPVACLWQAEQGLVVPRTYRRHASFSQACMEFAQLGWPVTVRQSGGGLVPQGPGIVNLSLAYAASGAPLNHSDAAYRCICSIISGALAEFGIATRAQAVAGSFCDGRYNLAWGSRDDARKIAGTAQLWRRIAPESGPPAQVVLVHALVLAAVDVARITDVANRFEQALGREQRYAPEKIASLHDILERSACGPEAFVEELMATLGRRVGATPAPVS